ncbi:MAG TPA: CBS domain-containing protein [Patescibacteria group bacterium]|nr:CBS domain-containing protein [Patescibacteria group bacterium]
MPVKTVQGAIVGKLDDLLFLASETPLITKLVIKTKNKYEIIALIDELIKLNGQITIKDDFKQVQRSDDDMSLLRNLLDKQIIDVGGHKVVRVNDVTIQEKENKKTSYYISGVDIGVRGILRWLRLEEAALPLYKLAKWDTHPHFLSWTDIQPLELSRGNVQLKKGLEHLERIRPEDLADYLEKTTIRNVNKIVSNLDEDYAAEVISDLNTSYQTALFRRFSPEKSAELITLIDPDEAVDILLTLSEERRRGILESLPKEKNKELEALLKLSSTPIGELVTPDYFTASATDSIGNVLDKVKEQQEQASFLPYIYVLNEENELVGVLSVQQLLTLPHDAVLRDVMEQNLIAIHITTPRDIAVKKMLRYKVYALPVLDNAQHIEGVVRFDDLAETVLQRYA